MSRTPAEFRTTRLLTAFAASAATIALLAGCTSAAADTEGADTGRTVDTILGEVTVPEKIEAVVVIEGRRDLDIALALNLPVVGFPTEEEGALELEGTVVEALPNAMFKVQLDNGHEVLGHVAGKMRRFRIRILPGDRVRVEVSPYDLSRARIVYRHR